MKKPITYAAALIIAISASSANAQDKEKKDDTKKPAAKTEKKEEEKKPDVEINIKADTLAYDTAEFTVTAGQTVKINLESISALPKAAGGHNLIILTKGTDVAKFATVAMAAPTTEYVPQDKASQAKIIAKTKMLGPMEKTSVTFTAPAAGTYDYVCTFPGHFAIMKGKMIVKAEGAAADKKKAEGAKKEAEAK